MDTGNFTRKFQVVSYPFNVVVLGSFTSFTFLDNQIFAHKDVDANISVSVETNGSEGKTVAEFNRPILFALSIADSLVVLDRDQINTHIVLEVVGETELNCCNVGI